MGLAQLAPFSHQFKGGACYTFILSGAAVAYKSKTQTITATSSTEAEFIAAVAAAKTAKYLRSVLADLKLFEDNMAGIQIVNAKRPTERS